MNVLDEINANRRYNGPDCRLRVALEALPADEALEFRELIYDKRFHGKARGSDINAAFERRGITLPDDTVARHRRGLCVRCASA